MNRAGTFLVQAEGYEAFIPRPLPPERIDLEGLTNVLAEAERAVGRLDGSVDGMPNPDLFVAMYVRQEAVLSSQIEGTQSSLEQILRYEAEQGSSSSSQIADFEQTINYVRAMNHGLARLGPGAGLSLELICAMHHVLMQGVRGGDKSPGEFRREQNWIGKVACPIEQATFIPPPPAAMLEALRDLEAYLQDRRLPTLIVAGLAHAQFETIHPFRDGNGRMGRLLITLLLCQRGVLLKPLLYLSLFFKRHRQEYYTLLQSIRTDGDWEVWLGFFLLGVREMAEDGRRVSRAISAVREEHRALASVWKGGYQLIDALCRSPYMSPRRAEQVLGLPYARVNRLLQRCAEAGIVSEVTGRKRDRVFRYGAYIDLFAPS